MLFASGKLKLSVKAYAIVVLCLIFELVLSVVLLSLLSQSEAETSRAERGREILRISGGILKEFAQQWASLSALRATGDRSYLKRCETAQKNCRANAQKLHDLATNDAELLAALKKIDLALEHERVLLDGLRTSLLDQPAGLAFFDLTGAQSELESGALQLLLSVEQLNALENRRLDALPSERNHRTATKQGLLLSLAANSMLAIALTMLFNRDIAQRLNTVVSNTRAFAEGKALSPVLSGVDEIAELDLAFHQMARVVEENARKERAIIDHAVDVICSIDNELKLKVVNDAAKRVTGFAPQELTGQSIAKFISAASMQRFTDAAKEMQDNYAIKEVEVEFARSDGATVEMLWSVHWSDLEQSYFCIMHDISARKKLDRMRREFVSIVSHELKTPLCSAQMCLSMLSEGMYGELNPEGVSAVHDTEEGVARLVRLVNELLDAEKMQSISIAVRPTSVSVEKIVLDSLSSVEGFATDAGIRVSFDRHEWHASLHCLADADKVIQVMVNLLTNAIKYSPPNGIVSVSLNVVNGFVEFRVKDQGAGVPSYLQSSIFEKFIQINPRGGLGLGLPIAKEIVLRHGGEIGVSTDGGSCFWFTIPLIAEVLVDEDNGPEDDTNG